MLRRLTRGIIILSGGCPPNAGRYAMAENIFSENNEVNGLRITEVRVYPFKDSPSLGHLRGLAQIVLNGCLLIRALRVMDGPNGLFVAYPLDPFYKGEEFKSIVTPMGDDFRSLVERTVLVKYEELIRD